jgi:tRNA pseudouridine55 synthase
LDGFVCIDKEEGPTSFDVVRRIRTAARQKRAGHAGTLDPKASGLLIIAIGRATRLLPYLPLEPKHYLFSIQFGCTTDTLDSEGTVLCSDAPVPGAEQLEAALPAFRGRIQQVPPRYSAVKINGTEAYKLARASKEFSMKARPVTVHELSVLDYDAAGARAQCRVKCSGGTYVRSLARDIALAAGSQGYAASIRRTAIGSFSLDDAVSLKAAEHDLDTHLWTPVDALRTQRWYEASEQEMGLLLHGRDITAARMEAFEGEVIFVRSARNELIAVTRCRTGGILHPERVMPPQ